MSSLFDSIHNPNNSNIPNRAQSSMSMPPPAQPAPEHRTPNLVNRFNQLQATIDSDWTQIINLISQQDTLSDDIQNLLKTATSIDHYLANGIHASESSPITLFMDNPTPHDYFIAMQEKRKGCLCSAHTLIEEYGQLDKVIKDSVAALRRKEADLRSLRSRILQSRVWELEIMKTRLEALVRKR